MDSTKVREIMSGNVATLTAGQPVDLAGGLMKRSRVRHLPVVKDGDLVGLVTHRDLLRAQARLFAKAVTIKAGEERVLTVLVDEIMSTELRTVTPDTPAIEAARQILDNKNGCLPVVEGGELVGIVTEADFVKWAMRRLDAS